MLPDAARVINTEHPGMSQCTYRCVVLPDLTLWMFLRRSLRSQCTYRCVVLPDASLALSAVEDLKVSMHLQVRGAP